MTATWIECAEAVGDAELAEFRRRICVARGHIGTAAIGSCSRCGGFTASSSMSLCQACGEELGVCEFDGRLTGWGSEVAGEPEANAARWLALLMRGYSYERAAARRALAGFPLDGLAGVIEQADDAAPAGSSPVSAELIVGFDGGLPDLAGEFLGAPIVRADDALCHAVVRPTDARAFEAAAGADPRVAFVELNRQ